MQSARHRADKIQPTRCDICPSQRHQQNVLRHRNGAFQCVQWAFNQEHELVRGHRCPWDVQCAFCRIEAEISGLQVSAPGAPCEPDYLSLPDIRQKQALSIAPSARKTQVEISRHAAGVVKPTRYQILQCGWVTTYGIETFPPNRSNTLWGCGGVGCARVAVRPHQAVDRGAGSTKGNQQVGSRLATVLGRCAVAPVLARRFVDGEMVGGVRVSAPRAVDRDMTAGCVGPAVIPGDSDVVE